MLLLGRFNIASLPWSKPFAAAILVFFIRLVIFFQDNSFATLARTPLRFFFDSWFGRGNVFGLGTGPQSRLHFGRLSFNRFRLLPAEFPTRFPAPFLPSRGRSGHLRQFTLVPVDVGISVTFRSRLADTAQCGISRRSAVRHHTWILVAAHYRVAHERGPSQGLGVEFQSRFLAGQSICMRLDHGPVNAQHNPNESQTSKARQ